MTDTLRTRIAAAIDQAQSAWDRGEPYNGPEDSDVLADAVIAAVPELRRIDQVRQVCLASINADRVPGEALTDRAWLADTVLNVLNGEVDE